MCRFCLMIAFGLLISAESYAQDVHFSQYYHAQMYTNPSFNGLSPGMSRFSMNAKNQWIAANSPYQSFLASFDNSWIINKQKPTYFSYSALVYYDVAGDANFSTTQFSPSFSYNFLIENIYSSIVSIGIQPSIVQRSLDMSKLNFDSQFNGYFFEPDLFNNEIIDNQTIFYPELSAGAHYINFFDLNSYMGGGISLNHINRPVVSIKGSDSVRLSRKLVVNSEGCFDIKNIKVMPSFYWAKQNSQIEFLFGARAVFNSSGSTHIDNNLMFRKNFLLGLYYRGKDAMIVYVGSEFQNYHIGISYDINLSRFTPASRGRGGIEVSASYIWQKTKKTRNKDIPCPIF